MMVYWIWFSIYKTTPSLLLWKLLSRVWLWPDGLHICLQCRRPGFNPWVRKIAWRRERLCTLVFWPREFYGLYSPWGRKEPDTTEQLLLLLLLNYFRVFYKRLVFEVSTLQNWRRDSLSAITQIHFSRKVSLPGLGPLAFHTRQGSVLFQLLCIYNSNRTFKDWVF